MKKKITKMAVLFGVLCFVVIGFFRHPQNLRAAGNNVTVATSASSLKPGESFTVTVGFSADKTLLTAQMDISYSSSALELVKTESISATGTSSGNPMRVLYDSANGAKSASLVKLTFKVKSTAATGTTTTIKVASAKGADEDFNTVTLTSVSKTISIVAPKSTDATLKTLTISKGTLSPSFSASTTSYTATVENSVTSITVGATANHSKATVSGTGSKSLSVGTNTITVKVTAESGATKTYTIKVTRKAAPVTSTPTTSTLSTDATLKSLSISGVTLSPSFKSGTISYTAEVPYDTKTVTVNAAANHSKAKVSGTGSKSLSVGTNTITVKVTAESGATKTYTIKVTRKTASSSSRPSSSILSSNNKLKSLTISNISDLYFSAGQKEYDAKVAHSVSSVTVTAIAQDEDAKVTIRYNGDPVSNGVVSLRVGSANYINISVEAPNGSERQYNIQIVRSKEPDEPSEPDDPVTSIVPPSSDPTSSDTPSTSEPTSSDAPSSSEPESSEPDSSDVPPSSDEPTSSKPDAIVRPKKDLSGLVMHTAYIGGMIFCLLAGCMLGYFIRDRRKD